MKSKGKKKISHLLSIRDLSRKEILDILCLAEDFKSCKLKKKRPLEGCSVGLIFQKPSNRTRVSFEVGIYDLGGNAIYLRPEDIQLGERESVADVAKVLTRYLDGIVVRTFKHEDLEELAENATMPVVNALSDLFHPCQVLADIFTVKEKIGLEDVKIVFVGDGNNVCQSWLIGAAKLGLNFTAACPRGYYPKARIVKEAKKIAGKKSKNITVTQNVDEAVKNADVIYTDVWVSMGQEDETDERMRIFRPYQVNAKLLKKANPKALVMHCLPAHRGQEISSSVMDGPRSIVYDQAENRLHVQKSNFDKVVSIKNCFNEKSCFSKS